MKRNERLEDSHEEVCVFVANNMHFYSRHILGKRKIATRGVRESGNRICCHVSSRKAHEVNIIRPV